MNTALARRLALGDRVVWIGKDYEPSGQGTITRITAHQVEVRWDRLGGLRKGGRRDDSFPSLR